MNILHTETLKKWGGQQNRVLTEAAGLQNKGHKVIIACHKGSVLAQKARHAGIVEHSIRHLSDGKTGVITLDINQALRPDIAGDVMQLPFGDNKFDVAVCCQVLKHLPFDKFPAALSELRRVAGKRVIISLPHKRRHLKIEIDAPLIGKKCLIMKYPFKEKKIRSRQHFWEINRVVSYREVKRVLKKYFIVEKTFLNEINCIHRFFILKKEV